MHLAIGADHAGVDLKDELVRFLTAEGHRVDDLGTHGHEPTDYPDIAETVTARVVEGAVERAILICGSGVGVSVAANKVPGIRAGICHDSYSAHQGVEHDDMNVLVLGARIIGSALAKELVRTFIAARFTGEERHARRLAKVRAIEARHARTKD